MLRSNAPLWPRYWSAPVEWIGLSWLLLLPFLATGLAQDAVAQEPNVRNLVRRVESTSGPGQQAAIREVLKHYEAYSALVKADDSPISRSTARVIDNQRLAMVRDTWAEMARDGTGARTVIPVGSAANPDGPNYVPGKSDVDMIPYGFNSAEAADRFNATFNLKYGIVPATLQVHVLSPTNVKDWQSRLAAVDNYEKYNTVGGNVAVQQIMYDGNGEVWSYQPNTGQMKTMTSREWMGGNRPVLTREHAAGYYSDNCRYRADHSVENGYSPREAAFQQGKYDERNGIAYLASKGLLSIDQDALGAAARRHLADDDARLVAAAGLARRRDVDGAVRLVLGLPEGTPVSDTDVQTYLDKMESFNQRVGREVVEQHVRLALQPQNPNWVRDEIAGILANLPERQVNELVAAQNRPGNESVSQTITQAAVASQEIRARGAASRFETDFVANNTSSLASAPFTRDRTRDAGSSVGNDIKSFIIGVADSRFGALYNVWGAYQAELSQSGSNKRASAAAAGRALIEVTVMKALGNYASAVELLGRLAAAGVNLAVDTWQNDHLDRIYERFKNSDRSAVALNDIIHDMKFGRGGQPGAFRQFAIETKARLEKELGRSMTNADFDAHIDRELRKYLTDRHAAEQAATAFLTFVTDAEKQAGNLSLHQTFRDPRLASPRNQVDYLQAMHSLLLDFARVEQMVLDALSDRSNPNWRTPNPNDVWYLLKLWRRGDLEKFAEEFHRLTGTLAPPDIRQAIIDRFQEKHGGLGRFETAPDAGSVKLRKPLGRLGSVWSGAGAWIDYSPADEVNGKPNPNQLKSFGPFEVGAGRLKLTRQCSPPYDQSWISGSNTAVAVTYQPRVGNQWGPAEALPIDNGHEPVYEGFATIPGPGVISVQVGVCYGAGNFSWMQYQQAWNASLEMVELNDTSVPRAGDAIQVGDRVRIEYSSSPTIIRLPDGRFLIPEAGSEFSFTNPETGLIVVEFHNGKGRISKSVPQSGQMTQQNLATVTSPRTKTQVKLGPRTLTPKGTDLVFSWDGTEGEVIVVDGSAEVSEIEGNKAITIVANQRLSLATGDIQDATEDAELLRQANPLNGILKDDSPEAYGEKVSHGLTSDAQEADDSGWQWVDPGQDARFRLVGDGLHMEVPEGKWLDDQRVTAPQLLHKVTGDFDLETKLHVPRGVTDTATVIPVIHAVGSGMGYIAGQAQHFGASANYYRFDPIMAEEAGRSMMPVNNPLYVYSGHPQTVEAPDEPVYVRFNRRGDTWRLAWSLDGQRWQLAARKYVGVPDTVWIGWAFVHPGNNARPGESATFGIGAAKLMTAPYGSLPLPAWDGIDYRGQPPVFEQNQVTLVVDGQEVGHTRAIAGAEFEFDADVTIALDREQWPLIDTARYRARVGLQLDGNHQVYVHLDQMGTLQTESPVLCVAGNWNPGEAIYPETFSSQWRFVRQEKQVSIFRWVDNQWSEMAKFEAELSGKLSPFVEIENSVDGTPPVSLTGKFRVINNRPETSATRSPPTPAIQPDVLGNQDLEAIFTVSDEEFQTRFAGKDIRVTGTFQQLEQSSGRVVLEVGTARYVSGAQVRNGTPNAFENVASFSPAWLAGQIDTRRSIPYSDGSTRLHVTLEAEGEFGVLDTDKQSAMEETQPRRSDTGGSTTTQLSTLPSKSSLLTAAGIEVARRKISDRWQATPEPDNLRGWAKSWHDPNYLLVVFPQLKLQEGYRLRGYLHREENNGSGVVWAMPADAEYPEPSDCPVLEHHFLQAPKPFDALADTMEGIEGDGSESAYLAASILKRELMEFGALWHGLDWGAHSVLDASPFRLLDPNDPGSGTFTLDPKSEWTWREKEPIDYRPQVVIDQARVVVTFYTYTARSGVDPHSEPLAERIMKHTDTYRTGKYRSSSTATVVGVGVRWVQF